MRKQTPMEETLNAFTHGIGSLLGMAGLVFLLLFPTNKTPYSLCIVLVYGLSIIILFTASTLYHWVKDEKLKHYLRILDHISIYLLIAGTYTPVALIVLPHSFGWELFWIEWGVTFLGIFMKLFYTGRFEFLSVLLYLVLGWMVVFDFSNLSEAIGSNGVLLLFAGGLSYTLGIVFYALDRIPYSHVIWHLFVLGGAICHYLLILLYVV